MVCVYLLYPISHSKGEGRNAADYLYKSQIAAYESHRAMFEGYSRNKYTSTGVIQWMLNNAFPQMVWHLYDFYFNPGGSYFGAKKGCELLHPQWSPADNAVYVVNSAYVPVAAGIQLKLLIFDLHGKPLQTEQVFTLPQIHADNSLYVTTIDSEPAVPLTYMIRLSLWDGVHLLTTNDYWQSSKPDILDWKNSTFYTTFCTSYADFTVLQTLPHIELIVEHNITTSSASVRLTNPLSDSIVFAVHVRLIVAVSHTTASVDVAPIDWSDNFITLLPAETRTVTAQYPQQEFLPKVVIESYNNVCGGHNI